MQDKDERLFKYIQARITQNFTETWYAIFVQTSTFVLPVLLCICLLHRIVFTGNKPHADFDFTKTWEKIEHAEKNYGVPSGNDAVFDLL
jgi:hypothetical protein